MINEKVNRRQPFVKANISNDSPNKSSSLAGSSGSSLSSAQYSQRVRATNQSRNQNENQNENQSENSGRTEKSLTIDNRLSAFDKLIEEHLALRGQLGGHLDTSKIDLDLLVNSLAGDQQKSIDLQPAANRTEVLSSALDKPKSESGLKPESRFRFQFFKEPRWTPEELGEGQNSDLKERTVKRLDQSKRSKLTEPTAPDPNKPNRRAKRNASSFNAYDEALPASFPRRKDWRESDAISEIDNQGVCGACWAHSTLETIESMAGE